MLCALPGMEGDGLLPLLEEIALLFPHGETNGRSAGLACQEAESGALTLALSVLRCRKGKLEAWWISGFHCVKRSLASPKSFLKRLLHTVSIFTK